VNNLLKQLEAAPSAQVKIGVTDIDGVLRTKYLHRKKVISALQDGIGFCNVIFGWDSQDTPYDHPIHDPGYADSHVSLRPETIRRIPWENGTPFLLADFADSDDPASAACPRSLLRRVVAQAANMGFTARFGPEYEWFVYRETPDSLVAKDFRNLQPLTPGMFGYSGLRTGMNADYFADLFGQLDRFGVELEGLHTETGPGVLEAAISHQPALEAADRAVLFKQGVRQISYRHGLLASFMAKPRTDLPGCGGHLHQSLWRDGKNAFHDEAGAHGMSDIFKHYLAGQLALLPNLLPLFAPTVNSYKRYVSGSWSATRCNWGIDNRTVALRVIPGGPKGSRLETRVPGSDANPYLAIAAALAAGLYGIKNKLPLNLPPVTGSAYEQNIGALLPNNLGAAAGAMEAEGPHHDLLGKGFTEHFIKTRHWEWQRYQAAVTDWELKRYLEII
jgi:glutamine synthetase